MDGDKDGRADWRNGESSCRFRESRVWPGRCSSRFPPEEAPVKTVAVIPIREPESFPVVTPPTTSAGMKKSMGPSRPVTS